MSEELNQLKAQADTLGIPYKANIGVEALRAKVAATLNGTPEPDVPDAPPAETPAVKAETEQQIRDRLLADATKLIRCRITCLNPNKAQLKGEVITVGNKYTGAISKFVAYGEGTDAGYHIPQIILDELKQRQFNSLRSEKGANGVFHPVQRLVKEFAIEILDPLTPAELSHLAATQAAGRNID